MARASLMLQIAAGIVLAVIALTVLARVFGVQWST